MQTQVETARSHARVSVLPFAVVCFCSALLLFLIQPIVSKRILPWYGGSKGVWTAAMLFFQTLLLLGYLHAHVTTWLAQKWNGKGVFLLHAGLALAALCFLPVEPSEGLRPIGHESPLWHILRLLFRTVGIPYFLLSATGPLTQAWLSAKGFVPYRLYAVSNVGSLVALLLYPFLLEPLLSISGQVRVWSVMFGVLVPVWLFCAFLGVWNQRKDTSPDLHLVAAETGHVSSESGAWNSKAKVLSVLLPGISCGVLLSITEHLCEDVAVIPFLWVVPLSVYLASFILCFESDRFYKRRFFAYGVLVVLALLVASEAIPSWLGRTIGPYPYAQSVGLYLLLLFGVCMLCHGEVAWARPGAVARQGQTTAYYLRIAFGGVLGSLFVALFSPKFVSQSVEFAGALTVCFLLALLFRLPRDGGNRRQVGVSVVMGIAIPGLVFFAFSRIDGYTSVVLRKERNFYGEILVRESKGAAADEHLRALFHGGTIHGVQYQNERYRRDPIAYFDESSGVGLAMLYYGKQARLRVGVVGLGIGTLATYARPGDSFRFYELNPAIVKLAREYFSYLSDCKGELSISLGDARLSLHREPPQQLDVLVLDAFSGDSVPTHLLTREAMAVYRKHVTEQGTIAIQITNRYLNLVPVVRGLAHAEGFQVLRVRSPQDDGHEIYEADWMLLTKNAGFSEFLTKQVSPLGNAQAVLWTDDFSPLFSLLLK
ncbi:MAG TPA: fused MFS/spermidine synthase [Pseudomonadota bacterium]|nr:fused MFS/spermidine synthase [Pseudomonadota bacterium]